MPRPATHYDTQLIKRFGSIDAFHALRNSPDPAEWSPALDHIRLTENEKTLEELRSRLWTLTATGNYPRTGLIAQLDPVLNDMSELVDLRDDIALSLEQRLGLPAPEHEPAHMFDPHWHLTPAIGTARTTKAGPLSHMGPGPETHTPPPKAALSGFDARIEALVGDLDQLRALTDQPQADPALRELNNSHLTLSNAELVCLFYRMRINALTNGRWYVDGPLVTTICQAITALETHITDRDDHARALEQRLAQLEADAARDPARAAALMSAAPPTAVPAGSGDRCAAAQAVSPAAQHYGSATTAETVTPTPPNAAPAPERRR